MKVHLETANYDACPTYNDWLDDQYLQKFGLLGVLGFQPRPSLVLFTLSPDTYQAAFDDFQRQRQDELKEVAFSDFPSPIAHYFYRFENGFENELQRLHLLRDTWESIIDILHAIVVAECRFSNTPMDDPITFKDLLSDSVAQRLLNIERIITNAKQRGIDLQTATIVSISTLETMRDLNQTRNGFSHSAAQSESQARTLIGECYEDVISVFDDLKGLAEIQILRYLGQSDAHTLRCEVFRGHGFTKTIRNVVVSDKQIKASSKYFQQGQVLVSFNEHIFGLRPLVHYREDTTGHMTRLCMFRKTRGENPNRRVEYAVVGESTPWEEDRSFFKQEIDELRALFGLPPD